MTEPEEHTRPPESRICHECGTTIAAGVEECPRCALEAKLGSKGFEVDLEALGAELPQLEIGEEIGRGGMGVVFKARQTSLGRDVALKVLPKELDYDPGFSERFLRESRTLAGLSHPHVVAVHDAGQAAGHHYLLMEHVDGTDLAKLMKAGDVQSEQALSIVSQICEALQYAHDQGVVHRDIKPGNILLDREGRVKLGDFGLAKLVRTEESQRLTGTLQAMGTPHYMAPEQIERPLEVDHRADLYSLGVVLYELLTGELPIGRFEVPSKKADIDVRLDEVVMKSLEKEPDQRYQSASEVRVELQQASSRAVDLAPAGTTTPVESAQAGEKRGLSGNEIGILFFVVALLEFLLMVLSGTAFDFDASEDRHVNVTYGFMLGPSAFLCWQVVRRRTKGGEKYNIGVVLLAFAAPHLLTTLISVIFGWYFVFVEQSDDVEISLNRVLFWLVVEGVPALFGWWLMRSAKKEWAMSSGETSTEDRASTASHVIQSASGRDDGDTPAVPQQVRSLVENALAEAKQNEPAGAEKVRVAVNIELEADKGAGGVDWDAFDEVVVRTTYRYQQAQEPFEFE